MEYSVLRNTGPGFQEFGYAGGLYDSTSVVSRKPYILRHSTCFEISDGSKMAFIVILSGSVREYFGDQNGAFRL